MADAGVIVQERVQSHAALIRRLTPDGTEPGVMVKVAAFRRFKAEVAWLGSIWRQAPRGCVALNAFLDYHARISHPLVNPADRFSRPRSTSRFGG